MAKAMLSPFVKTWFCVVAPVQHFYSICCLFDMHFHKFYAI